MRPSPRPRRHPGRLQLGPRSQPAGRARPGSRFRLSASATSAWSRTSARRTTARAPPSRTPAPSPPRTGAGGGLVGPGGLGNFLVTGHRTTSTQPFAELPELSSGARVVVVSGRHRLVYEIVRTRETSFRRPASLRAQSAAVPGHPGRAPSRAMITLSTCATAEDHAAGNYWADEFHNPEHRIDKIGVLRSITSR